MGGDSVNGQWGVVRRLLMLGTSRARESTINFVNAIDDFIE